jgi:hypothetical protein
MIRPRAPPLSPKLSCLSCLSPPVTPASSPRHLPTIPAIWPRFASSCSLHLCFLPRPNASLVPMLNVHSRLGIMTSYEILYKAGFDSQNYHCESNLPPWDGSISSAPLNTGSRVQASWMLLNFARLMDSLITSWIRNKALGVLNMYHQMGY